MLGDCIILHHSNKSYIINTVMRMLCALAEDRKSVHCLHFDFLVGCKLRKGADGIANHFLKIGMPVISESLCDMFNLSIATGVFPDSWKIARFAPIFESGQADDRSNYRPISVLPFVSRVFERLIYNQLYDYLDGNKLLFSNLALFQSGFRTLHSVATCLLKCTSDWYLNMDKGQYTAMIFVDLKKAFDTVNHEILLKRLKKYGVIGSENVWFASFLCKNAVL